MYEYLGANEDDEISFTGDHILEFNNASVAYNGVDINKGTDAYSGTAITLAPGEKRDITLNVTLDSKEIRLLKGIFENGMYIEGFVFLESLEDAAAKYSIPFLGFYGDFYAADPFDSSLYDKGGIFGGLYLYTYFADDFTDSTVFLGTSDETDDSNTYLSLSRELSVLSPAVEGSDCAVYLRFNLLRNLKKLKIDILGSDGEKVIPTKELNSLKKAYLGEKASATNSYSLKLWDCRDNDNYKYIYDDGSYMCRLTGIDASGREFVKELEFMLDGEKPQYISHEVREDDGYKYLDITVSDNSFVKAVHAYAFNGKEAPSDNNILTDEEMTANGIGGEYTVTFDITKSAGQYIYIETEDISFNKSVIRIDMGK